MTGVKVINKVKMKVDKKEEEYKKWVDSLKNVYIYINKDKKNDNFFQELQGRRILLDLDKRFLEAYYNDSQGKYRIDTKNNRMPNRYSSYGTLKITKPGFIKAYIHDKIHIKFENPELDVKFKEYKKFMEEKNKEDFLNYYIKKDMNRFRGCTYEEVIRDINKGSWDLFDDIGDNQVLDISKEKNSKEVELETPIYARDPKDDIVKSGVIGIDFGTRSTVVVSYRDDNQGINNSKTLPIRISGNNTGLETAENYENATIMYFDNLSNFIQKYKEKEGRPDTFKEDVKVALEAKDKLKSIKNSNNINSFMIDLKQWASEKSVKKEIIDNKGKLYRINGYLDLKKNDFDPIEAYAYHIGCRINDMSLNSIFLEYYLSFPVTYELSVKTKILESFKKGIMKSLPNSILKDEKIMKKFRVVFGASEPASYAITAFKKFCVEPSENNEIGYSVFDFGGGTTDFSYGIYREKENSMKYDYEIQELDSGGDKYLGGENLLELIAFDVFHQNKVKLVKKGYTIKRPLDKKLEVGFESFVSESSISEYNLKSLMEGMREYWEGSLKADKKDSSQITVNLFNAKNELSSEDLTVDYEKLDTILRKRINDGVMAFIEKFKKVFKDKKLKEIYIFLAGNSSKSEFVEELFAQEIDEEMKNRYKIVMKNAKSIEDAKIQGDVIGLNSKTGVAFGLVELREGNGEVEYISAKSFKNNEEVNFKYCMGYSKKGRFISVIKFATEYNKWIEYTEMDKNERIEILYSDNIRSEGKEFAAIECSRLPVVNKGEKGVLYIRLKNPNTIEYVICENIKKVSKDKIETEVLK